MTVSHYLATRYTRHRNAWDTFRLCPTTATRPDLERAYRDECAEIRGWHNEHAAQNRQAMTDAYKSELEPYLHPTLRDPGFDDLPKPQQDTILKAFLDDWLSECSQGIGIHTLHPSDPSHPSLPPIRCLYSPSLADLCDHAFACVVVDEGVKMKGADTRVGQGIRQMVAPYRLVLTATPIKNRLPDIFQLGWWAAGGHPEATARFPFSPDDAEEFAGAFMVTERNLTKEAEATAKGEKVTPSRYKKFTPEVCNVHRLWKFLAPLVLRRRKEDSGEDIVPRVRKVVRCDLGTHQKRVYEYHLEADYRDKNGQPAIGAQLQALRVAAADPSSALLQAVGGGAAFTPLPLGAKRTEVRAPHRSAHAYTPKLATTLTLIRECLERKEQVMVFSAFNSPLDVLGTRLKEAGVRYETLDGRLSAAKRGAKAAVFKRGRSSRREEAHAPIPVLLAGVESMSEGHSFHRCNNVILIAYSWAYDKFKQALDRVHRLNSEKPVNVHVVLCTGTVDRKLESLIGEKSNASDLVLDGKLIGERTEEVSLAELLKLARREFNKDSGTVDEETLERQWPALRDALATAMGEWDLREEPASLVVQPSGCSAHSAIMPMAHEIRSDVAVHAPSPAVYVLTGTVILRTRVVASGCAQL